MRQAGTLQQLRCECEVVKAGGALFLHGHAGTIASGGKRPALVMPQWCESVRAPSASVRPYKLVGGAPLRIDDMHHRVDQSEVGERLREVPEVPAAPRVDLLRVELERARVRQQLLAQLPRLRELPNLRERRHQPEGADRKSALLA